MRVPSDLNVSMRDLLEVGNYLFTGSRELCVSLLRLQIRPPKRSRGLRDSGSKGVELLYGK